MSRTAPMPGPGFRGKLADPKVRHDRAVKAARARTSTDAHIRALVDAAPPLTDSQREQLGALLYPGVRETMARRAREAGAAILADDAEPGAAAPGQ